MVLSEHFKRIENYIWGYIEKVKLYLPLWISVFQKFSHAKVFLAFKNKDNKDKKNFIAPRGAICSAGSKEQLQIKYTHNK